LSKYHIPARVGEPQGVVEAVAVAVVSLRALLVLDHDVAYREFHVDEVKPVVVLVEGVAAVVELDAPRDMGRCPRQVLGAGRKQAVEADKED